MGEIQLRESGSEDLRAHAQIPIAFFVERILKPQPSGGPLDFVEHPLPEPWWKDYDAEEGADPASWSLRFDTSSWVVISAWDGIARIGGVVLFADAPGVAMLEGRSDLALIWDLRIDPAHRGKGIGGRLIAAAVEWARSHACRGLKVETQNINVGACRFYKNQGFELRSVEAGAYPNLPGELQMLWYRPVI
jgi:GNAT superfamily N-acetyltransferase